MFNMLLIPVQKINEINCTRIFLILLMKLVLEDTMLWSCLWQEIVHEYCS